MAKTKYLLDTNICIFLLRGNRDVADKLIELGEGRCLISEITVYELLFGAYNSGRKAAEINKVKNFIKHFPIAPLMDSADEYASLKVSLRAKGIMIDEFDLIIASAAIARKYVLVTDNLKHFQRIEGLKIENWIKR